MVLMPHEIRFFDDHSIQSKVESRVRVAGDKSNNLLGKKNANLISWMDCWLQEWTRMWLYVSPHQCVVVQIPSEIAINHSTGFPQLWSVVSWSLALINTSSSQMVKSIPREYSSEGLYFKSSISQNIQPSETNTWLKHSTRGIWF